MKLKFAVAALAGMASLAFGSGASMANDATAVKAMQPTAPAATASYESSMVPTQARGRGRGGVIVAGPRRRNNTGRNVAIGAGALILGGIIASQAAQSRPAPVYRSYGGGNSCGRWDYRCSRGDGYACRQLNRYC